MAHGNYNCCAICDCKMDYNGWNATTKEEICEDCLEELKNRLLNINNVNDLKNYILNGDYKEVKKNLIELGYEFCWYSNDLDKEVFYRFCNQHDTLENILNKLEKGNSNE